MNDFNYRIPLSTCYQMNITILQTWGCKTQGKMIKYWMLTKARRINLAWGQPGIRTGFFYKIYFIIAWFAGIHCTPVNLILLLYGAFITVSCYFVHAYSKQSNYNVVLLVSWGDFCSVILQYNLKHKSDCLTWGISAVLIWTGL
jgi:hypothetical protein